VYSYQVPRAEFDTVLLDNARQQGVTIHQPAPVASIDFDSTGATLVVEEDGTQRTVRARFVVDASGRDGFLATRLGRRQRIPNLGKVALFGHFKGADRLSGKEEGNIRVYLFDDGWFWWIPLAGDVTSVGAVLHARTMRAWEGSPEECFAEMIRRCTGVAEGLEHAQLVTPVHRAANFAYKTRPIVGDRFLMVGDAVAFVDPIFSGGVYIAMRTAELAAESITEAFAKNRFTARYFARYERRVWSGLKPFFKFIHKYYEPGFIDLFMKPKNVLGSVDAVLNVLSGGSFLKMTWKTRFSLTFLFNAARMNTWRRKRAGKPIESKLEW
jgi:flavin-dependent dehydrogenase